jgi:penicillin amidase
VLHTSASRRARLGVATGAPSALAEGIQERDAILAASLAAAYDSTRQRYGAPNEGQWRWDEVRHANIYHLLRIPAFSRLDLPIRGGPETLNPSSGQGTQGASWRMVVQLGPQVRAWAVYPGGQSGNPVSSRYADRLPLWLAGTLDPVRFPHAAADLAGPDVCAVLTLEPRR